MKNLPLHNNNTDDNSNNNINNINNSNSINNYPSARATTASTTISDNNNNNHYNNLDQVDSFDPITARLEKEQEKIIQNQQLFEIELRNTQEKERIKEKSKEETRILTNNNSISNSLSISIPEDSSTTSIKSLSKINIIENNKLLKNKLSAYQIAMSEFYNTIDPGLSNDDGTNTNNNNTSSSWSKSNINYFSSSSGSNDLSRRKNASSKQPQLGVSSPRRKTEECNAATAMNILSSSSPISATTTHHSIIDSTTSTISASTTIDIDTDANQVEEGNGKCNPKKRINEPQMPDATYEEIYGDAYVGGPIRYIYPSGYQNMRPRGTPWKLSIVVFSLFTWMSVFIVDHCSDQVDFTSSSYYETDADGSSSNTVDDDTIRIATGWCGSRMLYFMWVVSVIITALAAAYCSIIGYIKLRDFAVANSRSQPPGIIGRSDYYVRIDENNNNSPSNANANTIHKHDDELKNQKIYQSDGTPQFWGGHIYRPTQAACAVTSR